MKDSTLNQLWSKAVRALRGNSCVNCGAVAHSCHHIIKRRYITTKYDARNGLPLCAECHKVADRNSAFALSLISGEDKHHLRFRAMYTLKDWLFKTGQSRDEFMNAEGAELKRIIKGER